MSLPQQLARLFVRSVIVPGQIEGGTTIVLEQGGPVPYGLVKANGTYYVVSPQETRRIALAGVAYVAGPMRAKPQNNFPAFDLARDRLIEAGYFVFNPADLDRMEGINENTVPDLDLLKGCLARDMAAICRSTHIALLPGWEESSGLRPEALLASVTGLTFLNAVSLELMNPKAVCAVIGARLVGEYQAQQKQYEAKQLVN